MSVEESFARIAQQRDDLVRAALEHVAFDGWSKLTLRTAAEDLGWSPMEVDRLFPGGIGQVIEHYVALTDRDMMDRLAAMDIKSMKIRARIGAAIRVRLDLAEAHKDAVRAAVAHLSLPQNLPKSLRMTAKTVDLMWQAAGDTSTDHNWYTKRGLLAGVYGSTLMYWLDDTSDGHQATWEFMDRRIGNVMMIPKVTASLGKVGKVAGTGLRMGRKVASCLPTPGRVARQFGNMR
ncbi:COQ9 family protein [Thalassospira mesophila]|uniref:Ubiquinone biosynthesis protein n=1 Tax=Thalassospira mesophila TaxID=1293891 RepID=A0A1Y2L088_9PROT|nr:COQ9 family protein [Thalassospira mesophila]OSQ38261.1 ubiquinone biosynthesis protein [Thalassospira mesophila]